MFAEHFVATHQQVGDFTAVKVGNRVTKNGGNLASHFCTPEGRVIHSVTGPVSADRLMEEAQWALDQYAVVERKPLLYQMQFMSYQHGNAALASEGSAGRGSRARRVHELFAVQPLAPLAQVYDEIFQDILGQRVTKAGPNLALASRGLELAEKSGRPLLFVLHDHRNNQRGLEEWIKHHRQSPYARAIHTLLDEYVVILLPLREMPALSQLIDQPPFEASSNARPLFVTARYDGKQIDSVEGWGKDAYLVNALSYGIVTAMQERPPSLRRIRKAVRNLKDIDPTGADDLRALAKELLQQQAAK